MSSGPSANRTSLFWRGIVVGFPASSTAVTGALTGETPAADLTLKD